MKIRLQSKQTSALPLLGIALFFIFSFIQSQAQVHPYTDPQNKGSWILNETVSDEFNGAALDTDKWFVQGTDGIYQNGFKGRAPSQFTPDNVSVSEGFVSISTKWEPDFPFLDESLDGYAYGAYAPLTTAAIITKATFLYGYMEIRCQAADGPISSAFWTTGQGGEIDVFEHYGDQASNANTGKKYHTSFHDWRAGSETFSKRIWTNEHFLDFRVAEDFHIYGFEWDEDYIKIFVDGRLIRCVSREDIGDGWVVSNPQKVWLDSETFNWLVKPENMQASDFPGEGRKYVVDYVRIWQKSSTGDSCESRENLLLNPGFEEQLEYWTYSGAVLAVSEDVNTGEGALKLNGLGSIAQEVSLNPNTTYILSAWIKLPGTNMSNIWHNAFLGVKNYGGSEVSITYFRPEYTHQSLQFETGETDHSALVFFKNANATHLAYGDDFSLVEAPDLSQRATHVRELRKPAKHMIYPNPASDILHVSAPEAKDFLVYNSEGQVVLKAKKLTEPMMIPVSMWPAGIYCISYKSDKELVTGKFILR